MKTLNLNKTEEKSKKRKVLIVNFSRTKRLQWDRFRRYGLYAS